MRHLEPMLGSFMGIFTHIFAPKLINFVSNTASGPWKLTGVDLVGAMKDLAAESFPEELVLTITPRQAFYEVVSGSITYLWHSQLQMGFVGQAEAVGVPQWSRKRGYRCRESLHAIQALPVGGGESGVCRVGDLR